MLRETENIFNKLITRDVKDADAHLQLATVMRLRKHEGKAVEHYRLAIESLKKEYESINKVGQTQFELYIKSLSEQIETLEKQTNQIQSAIDQCVHGIKINIDAHYQEINTKMVQEFAKIINDKISLTSEYFKMMSSDVTVLGDELKHQIEQHRELIYLPNPGKIEELAQRFWKDAVNAILNKLKEIDQNQRHILNIPITLQNANIGECSI